jgi:hypothetical protein
LVREIAMSKSCREALLAFANNGPMTVESFKSSEPLNDPRSWFQLAIAEVHIPNFNLA